MDGDERSTKIPSGVNEIMEKISQFVTQHRPLTMYRLLRKHGHPGRHALQKMFLTLIRLKTHSPVGTIA